MKTVVLILLYSLFANAEQPTFSDTPPLDVDKPLMIQADSISIDTGQGEVHMPPGFYLNMPGYEKLNQVVQEQQKANVALATENVKLKQLTDEKLAQSVSFTTFLAAVGACFALGFGVAHFIK